MTLTDNTPLGEARAWLRARVDDGERCPCCTQFAKVYKRKIYSTMCRDLITAVRLGNGDWFHLPTLLGHRHQGDFAKLVYWDLIEELDAVRDDGSNRAGWWRVTDEGVAFVRRRLKVPSHAHIYDGRLLGFSGDPIGIVDALGDKFNYDELMRGD